MSMCTPFWNFFKIAWRSNYEWQNDGLRRHCRSEDHQEPDLTGEVGYGEIEIRDAGLVGRRVICGPAGARARQKGKARIFSDAAQIRLSLWWKAPGEKWSKQPRSQGREPGWNRYGRVRVLRPAWQYCCWNLYWRPHQQVDWQDWWHANNRWGHVRKFFVGPQRYWVWWVNYPECANGKNSSTGRVLGFQLAKGLPATYPQQQKLPARNRRRNRHRQARKLGCRIQLTRDVQGDGQQQRNGADCDLVKRDFDARCSRSENFFFFTNINKPVQINKFYLPWWNEYILTAENNKSTEIPIQEYSMRSFKKCVRNFIFIHIPKINKQK